MSDGKLLFETSLDTKGFTTGLDTVKKTATSAFSVSTKAVTAITGAMAAGLTAATTQSVKAYADYEQLVGGVETLFKESESTVLEYANIAYKTAGLSANAYMDTVTSFSASLLQSLDGDTAAAATKADRAITDMADNANKMGTNMRDIQNAYQGFAKQNYTMLDNLKLGYGGTKEEMERLIATANEINAQQGIATSYSIDSFADIVDAIHVVQENLDITGTTAKEASTTIQGSIASLGAAWENFLTGMADPDQDFDTLLNNLIDSALTAADNLIPRIVETTPRLVDGLTQIATNLSRYLPGILQELLPSILDGTQALLDSVSAALPDLIGMAVDIAPQMVDFAVQLIGALAQGIIDNLPQILKAIGEICNSIIEGFGSLVTTLLPQIIDIGAELLENLIKGFSEKLPDALAKFLDFVQGLGDTLTERAPDIINWGFDMLSKLVDGITKALPVLIQKIPQIIITISGVLIKNFPLIVQRGAELIWQLITGILSSIPDLIAALPQIFEAVSTTLSAFDWIDIGQKVISFITDGIAQAWKIVETFFSEVVPELIGKIVAWFEELPSRLTECGNNALAVVSEAVTNIVDRVVQWVSELPETIMYWLGFILTSLILWGQDLINWATTAIPEFAETIVTFFSELPEKIAAFFGNILADLAVWASNMVAEAVETGTNFRDSIVTFFSQLPERIATLLGKVIGRILSFAAKMRERASDAGKGFFDNIVAALKDLPSRMSEIGKHIVDGIWTGISGGWDWLTGQVKKLADSLFQGAKDALEIHSPSKKFKWLGEMCVEGMDAPLADYNPYETLKDSMDAGVIRPELFAGAAITQPGDAVRNTAGALTGGSAPSTVSGENIDYEQMGAVFRQSVDGMTVSMDGRPVGKVIAPYVNDEIGKINGRRT